MSNNFGKPGGMDMQSNKGGKVQTIQNMEAVVDFTVVIQLLEIGLVLTLISSLASMISIQRFSPLTIFKRKIIKRLKNNYNFGCFKFHLKRGYI